MKALLTLKNGFHKMSIVEKNQLRVLRKTEIGLFLDTENREYDGILLPKRYVQGVDVGDFIDVFIYRDSEDRIIATRLNLIFALVNLLI